MRYSALHGSPGPLFTRFDPDRAASTSGYAHAAEAACFTSELEVAQHYAEGTGFIGRFAFTLEHPLELDDAERPCGIAALLAQARVAGHDGVILRGCLHTALSPGGPSDVFYVFDFNAPRLVDVLQEGPEQAVAPTPPPADQRRGR